MVLTIRAQGPEGGKKVLQDVRVQEILLKAQLYEISTSLKLSSSDLLRFTELYTSYFNEMRKAEKKPKRTPGKLSDADAEMIIKEDFSQAKRILNVRENYYEQFKTILSQVQILKMYDIERDINRKIIQEVEQRKR
ncbi:hypothetical protein MASR2M69_14970 [Bacteroidota bacterium]